jgi:hypothetical protein
MAQKKEDMTMAQSSTHSWNSRVLPYLGTPGIGRLIVARRATPVANRVKAQAPRHYSIRLSHRQLKFG